MAPRARLPARQALLMAHHSPEGSLEQLVPEQDFAGLLVEQADDFCRLAGSLITARDERWGKRKFFQLSIEADGLESFLDDHGARYNQTFSTLTELVASIRGFSQAGLSLEHLTRRLGGYGVLEQLPPEEAARAEQDVDLARVFVQETLLALLEASWAEMVELGAAPRDGGPPRFELREQVVRFRLPRNVGQEEIDEEEPRIAEVASKYIQACTMLEQARYARVDSPEARDSFLSETCSEQAARVYEATVHNLQSAYDTYIKNTVIEGSDERLSRLRGHLSAALHLLEALTQLTHFVERHESDVRDDAARRRLAELVPRSTVSDVSLNLLLRWADRFMQQGRELAEDLLPSYTNLQTLEVELAEGLTLHARPASMIVSIVNHHGTPVEMELEGDCCNAGSILDMMVVVGSHPEGRRYVFRGDEHPLRDIGMLFEHGLGEQNDGSLPGHLSYLRNG